MMDELLELRRTDPDLRDLQIICRLPSDLPPQPLLAVPKRAGGHPLVRLLREDPRMVHDAGRGGRDGKS